MGKNTNSDTPIVVLAAEYNFMKDHSPDKMTAQTVLENIAQIPDLTLEQAAQLCHVSAPTLTRFCRKLGYSSYNAFKLKITQALDSYNYRNQCFSDNRPLTGDSYLKQISTSLEGDIKQFSQSIDIQVCRNVVDALHRCSTVYIFDTFYSTIRLGLQSDLAVAGKKVFFSPDLNQQQENIKCADRQSLFLFVYDYSPRSMQILKYIPLVYDSGSISVVITPDACFPGKERCSFMIETGFGSSGISEMMLRDMVFQFLSILYRESYM